MALLSDMVSAYDPPSRTGKPKVSDAEGRFMGVSSNLSPSTGGAAPEAVADARARSTRCPPSDDRRVVQRRRGRGALPSGAGGERVPLHRGGARTLELQRRTRKGERGETFPPTNVSPLLLFVCAVRWPWGHLMDGSAKLSCGYTSPQYGGQPRYIVVETLLSCPHFKQLKWRKPKIDRHLRAFLKSVAWVHPLLGAVRWPQATETTRRCAPA